MLDDVSLFLLLPLEHDICIDFSVYNYTVLVFKVVFWHNNGLPSCFDIIKTHFRCIEYEYFRHDETVMRNLQCTIYAV